MAIAAGVSSGVLLALAVGALEPSWQLAGILAGTALVFVAGLVDDIRHLSPLAKLAAQFGAAGIAIAAGLRVELVENNVLGVAIALFWLVGITNAFNLLDNMDGLAATLAAIACVYFAIDAATVHENELVLVLSLSLAFACAGFLPFNLRPAGGARVFMGDAGSQLLGFLLGALALASSWTTAGTTVATMLLPLLVLAIPILDTTLVTVVRLVERRPVTQGGKDHSSHRLVYYGLSETRAVALLALIAVALGATSVAYNVLDRPAITALGVLLTFALLVQFGSFLSELSEDERRGRAGDTRLRHAIAVQPRRLLELARRRRRSSPARSSLPTSSSWAAADRAPARHVPGRVPIVLGTTYVVYVARGRLPARLAVRDGPRPRADRGGLRRSRRSSAFGIVVATRDLGDFPPGSSSSTASPRPCSPPVLALARPASIPEAGRRADDSRRRVLVVGAGREGRRLARDLRRDDDAVVVGFLDDNPRLQRRRVQGVPVLGTTDEAEAVLRSSGADELVASPPDPQAVTE